MNVDKLRKKKKKKKKKNIPLTKRDVKHGLDVKHRILKFGLE